MDITITIPDDMADEVNSWEDGQSYQFTATQDSTGMFTATEVGAAEAEDASETEDEGGMEEGGMGMKHKNPAIAIVMSRMAKGK